MYGILFSETQHQCGTSLMPPTLPRLTNEAVPSYYQAQAQAVELAGTCSC